MKTKREVLETIIEEKGCHNIDCDDCAYSVKQCEYMKPLRDKLIRIGAMALLRMFPEKREFDPNKVLTCVTADKAKIGMRGYFGDSLASLRIKFENRKQISELIEIHDEKCMCRFRQSEGSIYSLFYPIEKVD